MKSSTSFRLSSLVIFIIIAGYQDVDANECEYKISVKTADVSYAGTNSRITLILASKNGEKFEIPNLANWGINGPYYDYFERGNLDIFIGKAACVSTVCNIIVSSDESGSMSGWLLDYVEVSGGLLQSPVVFVMNTWLASGRRESRDPPYSLSSVSCNYC